MDPSPLSATTCEPARPKIHLAKAANLEIAEPDFVVQDRERKNVVDEGFSLSGR
jgi:hypothetical protein